MGRERVGLHTSLIVLTYTRMYKKGHGDCSFLIIVANGCPVIVEHGKYTSSSSITEESRVN